MSKLADILFKPIGIVVSADKVQIVRPNGDKISCAKECYFFLGDKIVNNSDEDVEVTINGEKVKLEPKESTTVVSIDQKTIDNIALLQKELIKGKSIDELEDTTAGKNLLDSVGAISDIVFIKSGHYSNVHASANDIDFIQNIKELDMAGPKQPNISEDSDFLYIPNNENNKVVPNEPPHVGGGEAYTPQTNQLNTPPSVELPLFIDNTRMRISFPKDIDKNAVLSINEYDTNKNTIVRVHLPKNAEINNGIELRKKDFVEGDNVNSRRGYFEDLKEISHTDIENGYIDFLVPINGLRENVLKAEAYYSKVDVLDGLVTPYLDSTKNDLSVEIDAEEAIKNLSFSIVDINGYGNHIGDSDLSNEKVNVQLKLDGYEALNPGYKVEVIVNGKRITATDFHGDGTFYAAVRLADFKDDLDSKVEAVLTNASYKVRNSDGTITNKPVEEKHDEASYTANFTKSYLTFDIVSAEVNQKDNTINYHEGISLADIRKQSDVILKGEIRGIYDKTGDVVHIQTPDNRTLTLNVQPDGTFETRLKPEDLGYPQNYQPYYTGHNEKMLMFKAKYQNDTGEYGGTSVTKLWTEKTYFGLTPTLEKAADNDSGLVFKNVTSDLKYSLSLDETEKIYSTANGGKFKLNLDFSANIDNDPDHGIKGLQEGDWTTPINYLSDSTKEKLSKLAEGWKYEVYLQKIDMSSTDHSTGYYSEKSWLPSEKIFEGTIEAGKTHYSHEFDIKKYFPTKPAENKIDHIFVKLVPPDGDKTYANIKDGANKYVFSADSIREDGDSSKHIFKTAINTFSVGEVLNFSPNLGKFSYITEGDDSSTLYYNSNIKKIDITGFLYKGYTDSSSSPYFRYNNDDKKPSEIYLLINNKKYSGTLDDVGGVRFKDIDLSDFKNDPDHKYEIVASVGDKDKYDNSARAKGQYSYNIVEVPNVSQAEIEKSFTFFTNKIAKEGDEGRSSFSNDTMYPEELSFVPNGFINRTDEYDPRILTLVRNKYVSHLDHDITFKISTDIQNSINGKLWWYDPSDHHIKEVTNGEILIKAGTMFKEIRIIQSIKNDTTSFFNEEDKTTNEFGGITAHSNMALKKAVVTTTIKNGNNEILATNKTGVIDDDYDIVFTNFGETLDLKQYVPGEWTEIIGRDDFSGAPTGKRKVTFDNTEHSEYTVLNSNKLRYTFLSFENDNTKVNFDKGIDVKEVIISKNNLVLNTATNGFSIDKITNKMTAEEIANGTVHNITFNGPNDSNVYVTLSEKDEVNNYNGLHILKGSIGTIYFKVETQFDRKDTTVDGVFDNYGYLHKKVIENLKISDDVRFGFRYDNGARFGEGLIFKNISLIADSSGYLPTLSFDDKLSGWRYVNQYPVFIQNSTIAGNIKNIDNVTFENTIIGSPAETITLNVANGVVFNHDVTFSGAVNMTAATEKNNKYVFDTEINTDFNLTDTTKQDDDWNRPEAERINIFNFGSHAKIGSHATFNVDHSTMTFENGSVFEGTIKSGTNTNNFVIKAGATFNGTIEMADAINNITIEDGAILGPNFHITETNTESEAVNAKYDTLTLFNDIDFTNLDVKGLDQINIGTKARGEMINMDIVFDELNSLLGGGKNTIKFWGDNDNHLTFHNEANRTFSVAADQSAVASQPYTRYEANDTASGTKYFIDVHNDINLQIL